VPQPVGQLGVDEQRRTLRAARRRDRRRCGPAAVVDQEDRLEVGPHGLVEREAVTDGASDGVLVRQDDAVLRGREAERAHQTALDVPVPPGLLVHVERRGVVGPQHAGVPPAGQGPRGTSVAVLGPVRGVPWEDEAYDVVLARCLERGHAVLVDHVVGR
jgi:hypothetical protein